MPPVKRKTWDHNAMIQAVNAVRRNEMGYLRAAKQFSVPKDTLERYVKKDVRAEDLVQFQYSPVSVSKGLLKFIMENFEFSSKHDTPRKTTFNGSQFFSVYKDAEFLRIDANVEKLLAQGYELRKKLDTVDAGKTIIVEGMNLERNTPLLIKKTVTNTPVEDYEFTFNRLMALAAGYAYENRKKFPNIQYSDAQVLGLVWDQNNNDKCKLYLSAVSGTEYMIDQFSFWPFLCGLRKFQLKKMPIKLVVKMGKIKNSEGETMASVMKQNLVTAKRIWLMFTGTSLRDLQTLIDDTPELKKLYHG
ncbi:hypothetical protein PYW07_002913 [Mythimna separata]|uniref:HTH psq-type domain-containing protein n=1 Tax=Mythimna separata TaxID=271217 RepID=A0AAD7YH91_MYTSE|nr:hypothetical protein PYW07_002913 [Mythimna separata]